MIPPEGGTPTVLQLSVLQHAQTDSTDRETSLSIATMKFPSLLTLRTIAASTVMLCAHAVCAQETKPAPAAAPADKFAKWEKEITAYEAADRAAPPPKGEVLFIGSSTIRLWKTLAQDFPDHRVINRGFGGSQIVDATHFAPRIVFPYEPRVIFLRSGGNDIHAGKSPEQVFADYLDFIKTVHAKLPQAEIIYIGLSPTIARIKEVEKGNTLNTLIKDHAAKNPRLKYIDCTDMTPGTDGKPRADLFVDDGLHFNAAGYKLLAERVRPFLPAPVKPATSPAPPK